MVRVGDIEIVQKEDYISLTQGKIVVAAHWEDMRVIANVIIGMTDVLRRLKDK